MTDLADLYGGMIVVVVEPGTVVRDERTGETITVADDCSVCSNRRIYCTVATHEALKKACANHDD